MSQTEWAVQLAVVVLLAVTLPMAWRLERMLRALRADRAALDAGSTQISEATRQAEVALMRLRGSTEIAGRQLNERVTAAEAARDDLHYLLERAEALAGRLEVAVEAARPLAASAKTAAGQALPRSEAERDLMRTLTMPR